MYEKKAIEGYAWLRLLRKFLTTSFSYEYAMEGSKKIRNLPNISKIPGTNKCFSNNFGLFSTLGGMNLEHDFVQVWKFSEDQKKNANRTLFLPEFRWRPKK